MNVSRGLGKFIIMPLIVLIGFTISQSTLHAERLDAKTIYDPNKTWIMTFTKEMDAESFEQNVWVFKEGYERQKHLDVNVVYQPGKRQGKVFAPTGGYVVGERYVLIVNNEMTSQGGEKLKETLYMPFMYNAPLENLDLELMLDKEEYSKDDNIVIKAQLTNTGDIPYYYQSTSSCFNMMGIRVGYSVYRYFDKPDNMFMCTLPVEDRELKPGHSKIETLSLYPKDYVTKNQAFYLGDDLSVTVTYKGKKVNKELSFSDIPVLDEEVPFPRSWSEVKEHVLKDEITKGWIDNYGISIDNLTVENGYLRNDEWNVELYEDKSEGVLSLGIDRQSGEVTYALIKKYEEGTESESVIQSVIKKKGKTTKKNSYYMENEPEKKIIVDILFKEGLKDSDLVINNTTCKVLYDSKYGNLLSVEIPAGELSRIIGLTNIEFIYEHVMG